ncbi:hypothetical protein AAFF_G00201110 [Aldrovandia affinis]|uniref:Uncharacterized protein n=1 Tax=Aldrovandia affinis TaxID=143900 RepID=A0AAD7RHT2_9TELE|nr:hypothetical protein AAFF_G00201110 [Aldrovandia affinis]
MPAFRPFITGPNLPGNATPTRAADPEQPSVRLSVTPRRKRFVHSAVFSRIGGHNKRETSNDRMTGGSHGAVAPKVGVLIQFQPRLPNASPVNRTDYEGTVDGRQTDRPPSRYSGKTSAAFTEGPPPNASSGYAHSTRRVVPLKPRK